jgi:uncharacterized protein YdeI (YjbR/CyaY-like superfamily)
VLHEQARNSAVACLAMDEELGDLRAMGLVRGQREDDLHRAHQPVPGECGEEQAAPSIDLGGHGLECFARLAVCERRHEADGGTTGNAVREDGGEVVEVRGQLVCAETADLDWLQRRHCEIISRTAGVGLAVAIHTEFRSSVHIESFSDTEVITCGDATAWEAWLAGHHDLQAGVWLKIAKKGSGATTVTVAEALDVALCYGWIDGQRKSCDETYFLQRYSQRRTKSSWSQVNTAKVAALVAAERMRAPGHEQIAAAKADGRWDAAYESQKNATVPPDLAAALAQNEPAKDSFEVLNKTERYAVILRLVKARTPDNRAAQLRKIVASLENGPRV